LEWSTPQVYSCSLCLSAFSRLCLFLTSISFLPPHSCPSVPLQNVEVQNTTIYSGFWLLQATEETDPNEIWCQHISLVYSCVQKLRIREATNSTKLGQNYGFGGLFPNRCNINRKMVPGRFVPTHSCSRERNCLVTFVPMNCRLLYNSVARLGRKPTRYSMHHYELFNYDYRVRLKWKLNKTFKTIRKSAEIINVEDALLQKNCSLAYSPLDSLSCVRASCCTQMWTLSVIKLVKVVGRNLHVEGSSPQRPTVIRYLDDRIQTAMITVSVHNRRTIRYDTRCYFNVRSKADISQLNLQHGNNK